MFLWQKWLEALVKLSPSSKQEPGDALGNSPLVKSHQTGREKKPCWGFYLLKQTEGSHATCCTSTQVSPHLWAGCSTTAARMWAFLAETVERRGTGCGVSSTMTTFKMSHTRVHCKDNTAAICITERPPRRRHFTPLFSLSGMSGILAWPFDCKKRRAPFLKEQRGILGVGSDGQGPFSLMFFSLLCLAMSEDSVKSWGAAPMVPLVWDPPLYGWS